MILNIVCTSRFARRRCALNGAGCRFFFIPDVVFFVFVLMISETEKGRVGTYTVENYDDCGVIAGNYLILKSIYRQTADSRQTKAHEAE